MTAPLEQAPTGATAATTTTSSSNATTSQFLNNVRQNLQGEHALPPALAVIASLTGILETHALPTLAETLDLLSVLSRALKDEFSHSGADPLLAVPVSAGLEVFQKWLLNAGSSSNGSSLSTSSTPAPLSRTNTGSTLLQESATSTSTSVSSSSSKGKGVGIADFEKTRAAFLSQAKSFVDQGLDAKAKIAASARRLFKDGCTVVVPSYDQVVEEVLTFAATEQLRFNVMLVSSPSTAKPTTRHHHHHYYHTSAALARRLRKLHVPTAIISPVSIAHHLSSCPPATARNLVVLAGAAAILSDGGILAPRGTQQACILARTVLPHKVDVWVVAEQWKSVRWFPAQDLKRRALKFSKTESETETETEMGTGNEHEHEHEHESESVNEQDALDITSPDSITGLVTDRGVFSPSALAEESIIAWF